MERVRCREIVLETYSVGTMDVMDYADAHPNEYFDFTDVRSKHTNYGRLIVSEYDMDESTRECFEQGLYEWCDLPNGWRRWHDGYGMFICRKGDRYIYITN